MKGKFGKIYRSIPHLPGSLKTDRKEEDVDSAMARYFTEKTQQKKDIVIVTEKLDGSCMGVIKDNEGMIHAVNRAGWPAESSRYKHQRYFQIYVQKNYEKFDRIMESGDRIVGEWMILRHTIGYSRIPVPWVVFDIFRDGNPISVFEHYNYLKGAGFGRVPIIFSGPAISIKNARKLTPLHGLCLADDEPEGFVYRIERDRRCIGIAKWVRPSFQPGKYLSGVTNGPDIWNIDPTFLFRPEVVT
jgi:hypothetical protein